MSSGIVFNASVGVPGVPGFVKRDGPSEASAPDIGEMLLQELLSHRRADIDQAKYENVISDISKHL